MEARFVRERIIIDRRNRRSVFLFVLKMGGILVLISLPAWVSIFVLTLIIKILLFALLVMSFSFLAGQLGLLSLMQSAFFGIAGYAVAILQVDYRVPFPIPPLVGFFGAIVFSALIGALVFRTREVYFLMLTLVLGQIVWVLALQLTSFTHGTTGILGIYAPGIFGKSRIAFYFLQLAVFLCCIGLLTKIIRSPFGLILRGIRDSESRMVMLGYPIFFIKLQAFVLSAALAAVGGIFFVYFYGVMNPDVISLETNINAMISSILGGVDSVAGMLLGAAIFKTLDSSLSAVTQRYMLVYGILFLFVILALPKGIVGSLSGAKFPLLSAIASWWRNVLRRQASKASEEVASNHLKEE